MGGRGASSGTSVRDNRYGSQYHAVYQSGNIKFVTKNVRDSETLMETMTRGRIYVHVEGNDLKSVVYFDNDGRRSKQIDLGHAHNGKRPHTHLGYEFPKGGHAAIGLSTKERQMVERVIGIWENRAGK